MKKIFNFIINILIICLIFTNFGISVLNIFIYALIIGNTNLYYVMIAVDLSICILFSWALLYALSHSKYTKTFPWSKQIYKFLFNEEDKHHGKKKS